MKIFLLSTLIMILPIIYSDNSCADPITDLTPHSAKFKCISEAHSSPLSSSYLTKGEDMTIQNRFSEARAYYRKAADLGNMYAQVAAGDLYNRYEVVGSLLGSTKDDDELAFSLYQCAAKHGEESAFRRLGDLYLLNKGQLTEALLTYHQGINAGNAFSASTMQHLFSGWTWMDILGTSEESLRLKPMPADPERARRYSIYRDYLETHTRSPNTPDVNKIIPLPPAALPVWDGVL